MATVCSHSPGTNPGLLGMALGLCLGLWTTPVWGKDLPLWPLPEGVIHAPLAENIRINGIPARIEVFHGAIPKDKVLAHFREACARLGGTPTFNQLGAERLQGCVRPPLSFTAQWHEESGEIYGQISTMSLDAKPGASPLPLALPGSTRTLLDMETEDGPIRGRVLRLQSDLSARQLHHWFHASLEAAGWRPNQALPNPYTFSGQRGRDRLDIAFLPVDGGHSQAVVVWDHR